MKEIIYVNTGEVKSGGSDVILNSGAIGSCVVITAYDPDRIIGAMAHVMLPGTAPATNALNATRYSGNAIEELINQLNMPDFEKDIVEICLAGGANVLNLKDDNIGTENINSIEKILVEKGLRVRSRSLGGSERRTVLFDIGKGFVYFTHGDSDQKVLWESKGTQQKNVSLYE